MILNTIFRTLNRTKQLNILTFPCHEAYETSLALTNHNFYGYRQEGMKDWNNTYRPVPENYILLEKNGEYSLPRWVDFDLVLTNNRFANFEIGQKIARRYNIPLVNIEHCLPDPRWSTDQIKQIRSLSGDHNIFISEYSRNKWLCDNMPNTHVIHHMIDTDVFTYSDKPRENHILSVVNLWKDRDIWCGYKIWENTINGLPYKVVGDNPGLSSPAKNIEELVQSYQQATIFYNTSVVSPIPTSLLEAAACGCALVSTKTCMIPEIFEHGKDAFLSNDLNELRQYLELLLNDTQLAREMGLSAKEKISKMFNKNRFINDWNKVLYGALN